MYTPTTPSSPHSPGGSQRYRQPSRHPTTTSGPPTGSPNRPNATSYESIVNQSNAYTPDRVAPASSHGARSGSRPLTGHSHSGKKEERTIVGTGTTGCGAAWEAQQTAAKEHHLENWEGKKATQKQQELLKEQALKSEDEKKLREEKEMKRRMFAENRFTTVEYTQRRGPNNGSPASADANGVPPPPPIVRNRSAVERRERNILPASATSPLRYRHFTAVVAKTQAFQKERQSWEEARRIEQQEHEAYIQTMRGNSPTHIPGADGNTRKNEGGQQGAGGADGLADPTAAGGNHGNTTTNESATHGNSPLRLPTVQTQLANYSCNQQQQQRRRETRSSSPPVEIAQQCRKEILKMRADNKAEVELQKERELLKHKELRHAVVTSHFNTFKSVKDLSVSKNVVVNNLRKQSDNRSQEHEELVNAIQQVKHDTFARQRREQAELAEKNRYVTAHENRRRVLKENEEERKRVEIRNQIKEKELEALKASADARRMIWAGSTQEHRKSADSYRQNTGSGKNGKSNGGFASSRMTARGASRQTDDGPVEVFV